MRSSDPSLIDWSSVKLETKLPAFEMEMTRLKSAYHTAATRDFFPGHHDPEYARSQGQREIYMNTMFFHGVLDRLALEWAGPGWRVVRRKLMIVGSVYVGDTLRAEAKVIGKSSLGMALTLDAELTVESEPRVLGQLDIEFGR